MKRTILLLLVLVLALTLFGSVATGEIVFFDDFEDGSATDGAPVTWSPLPGGRGSFDAIDGNFVMTRPSDTEEMYSVVHQYTLADMSIRTQARLIGSNAWWFGLFARGNVGDGTYVALLKNNASLEIWLFGPSRSSSWPLASANTGIDPRAQDVILRFDAIGNELSAWAWRQGDPMPAEPQVTAVHSEFATGGVGAAADLGSQYSNNEAIFRYVEVYAISPPPVIDFNGDGIVNIKDLLKLIQSWGQDDPIVDIAPQLSGDGVVDALDLEFLMSYWEQAVNDHTLIAHWALDETEGIRAMDSAGKSDGMVFGSPLWQPEGGNINGALGFDGMDDMIMAEFVVNPDHGPFSVFAWIKGGAPGQVIMSQQDGVNWLMVDTNGMLMTELSSSGGRRPSSPLYSETAITDGQWHRIGFVWDGVQRILYVDDIQVATDIHGNLVGSTGGLYIGTSQGFEVGTLWSGLIDDVRIYDRVVEL